MSDSLPMSVAATTASSAAAPAAESVEHVRPDDQPHSVCELARRLLPAYTVDGGTVRLAGCTLEDRFFGRFECRAGDRALTLVVAADGSEVGPELAETLGLERLTPLSRAPARLNGEWNRAREAALRLASDRLGTAAGIEIVKQQAVWCKYTEGKLRFTIGASSVDWNFAGWSRTLAAPAYRCPVTGAATFHLAATDDGQIVAAEQIERCSETGRRVLPAELVTCAATGRRVLAELTERCAVTGERVLKSMLTPCEQCRQLASPAAIERSLCRACRKLRHVSKADPRMARLFHEHPALDRWSHWRLAETAESYVLTSARWLSRLLLVVDRQTLEIRLVASRHRLIGGWNVATPEEYRFLLSDS